MSDSGAVTDKPAGFLGTVERIGSRRPEARDQAAQHAVFQTAADAQNPDRPDRRGDGKTDDQTAKKNIHNKFPFSRKKAQRRIYAFAL